MQSTISKESQVADTRIKMTAFLLLCIMLPSSFMPEETVVKWLIINTLVLIFVLGILYFTWHKFKFDTVRYYSLQVYILLMSIVFYTIVPLFKLLNDSYYFWLIALATTVIIIMAHVLNKRTTLSFVNKKHKKLAMILSAYVTVLIFVGAVLSGMMHTNEAPENTGVSILFYLGGLLFIVLAPMFLLTKSEVDKLAKT